MNEEKNEKKNKKKINPVVSIIIAVIVLLVGIVFFYVQGEMNRTQEKEENNESVVEEEKELVLTDEVKEWISDFVNFATYRTPTNNSLAAFEQGTTSIDTKTEMTMTLEKLKPFQVDTNVPQSIRDEADANNEDIYSIPLEDINRTYKELFKEEANYTFEDLSACPFPYKMDESTGKLYLLNRCGGATACSDTTVINSYNTDTDYYYAHSVTTEECPNATKEIKLLWVFDKDYKFVRTEVE